MVISSSHRFVFVHVPKTGGTSMRAALEPFGDGQADAHRETTHETLPELLARAPHLVWHGKFGFVRSPWDRLVSFHAYARERLKPTLPEMQTVSFAEMLRLLDAGAAWLTGLHVMRPQSDYLEGADFVGHFERIEEDFAHITARFGLTLALPRKNPSRHGLNAAS